MKTNFVTALGISLLLIGVWGCKGNTGSKKKVKAETKPATASVSTPVAEPASGNAVKTSKKNYNPTHDFTVVDVAGDTIRLSDFAGKVVILDIWDTWCPPCRMEIPDFIKLYSEYKTKGFQMIGLAVGQQGIGAVRSFIENYGINYPVAIAPRSVLMDYGPIRGIPTTFVLDKRGKIVKKYVGYRQREVFENDILTLLKE